MQETRRNVAGDVAAERLSLCARHGHEQQAVQAGARARKEAGKQPWTWRRGCQGRDSIALEGPLEGALEAQGPRRRWRGRRPARRVVRRRRSLSMRRCGGR